MADLDAWTEEVGSRRHHLALRLAELAEMAGAMAARIRGYEEQREWERTLTLKMTAVREAAALLRAAEQ